MIYLHILLFIYMNTVINYIKLSFEMLGNIVTGNTVKPKHTEDYLKMREDILNVGIPSRRMDKINLSKDRMQAALDLKKTYEKKVNG